MQFLKQRAAIVGAALTTMLGMALVLAGPSGATPPDDPVTDAFTDLGTKIALYGAALVTLTVIAIGIMVGLKYLKKSRSAA